MEGISITKLLVVGILIVLLFGTSKLRTLGADLGAALKGFKKAMGNDDAPPTNTAAESKVVTEAKPPIEHKD
ncbi:Sec-independent protein translocase subunit TatA [Yersinia enterocolitica]|nr:Sec-independent protein translocase subunit TatA [Yersinia enterocolitica]EKN3674299.1 Sec-independent protein translocase subunit TatA [Yersinia enterocolitica]ELI8052430.1 Sec-independent protein translocase subunit TatA [Yersinia enterocolitica]